MQHEVDFSLSVITPDIRLGMRKMLKSELEGIKNKEIIYRDWRRGVKLAKNDFVLLLESDSALEKGSIRSMIQPFLDNPNLKKLAMVSPRVEFDDSTPQSFICGENGNITIGEPGSNSYHFARVGMIGGAIIRRTSLLERQRLLHENIIKSSLRISIDFWDHGLRVMHDPQALYCSPQELMEAFIPEFKVSSITRDLWKRELIA